MPPLSQYHIDTALTNYSLMYANEESQFIAEEVFPVLPVAKRSDKYFIYPKATFVTPSPTDPSTPFEPLSMRRPGTKSAELNYTLSSDSFYCNQYAFSGLVTDEEVAYADSPLAPDMDMTRFLVDRIKLDTEMMVAKKVGTWAAYNASNNTTLTTGTTSWAAYTSSSSDPFTDLRTGVAAVIAGCLRKPNRMLLTGPTSRVLVDHPVIKDAYKYTHQDLLTLSGLPRMIRGMQVIETDLQKLTSAAGATETYGQVWTCDTGTNGDMAVLYYHNGTPGLRSVGFGYQFESPDETTGVRGWCARRWRDDPRRGSVIEVSVLRDFKFIAVDGSSLATAGYIIAGVTD